MCHERWAKLRDEAVESQWLRDMRDRERVTEPVADEAGSGPVEDELTLEPVAAADR